MYGLVLIVELDAINPLLGIQLETAQIVNSVASGRQSPCSTAGYRYFGTWCFLAIPVQFMGCISLLYGQTSVHIAEFSMHHHIDAVFTRHMGGHHEIVERPSSRPCCPVPAENRKASN